MNRERLVVHKPQHLLAGAPISWSSRKQPCIALSSTEAEYISASSAMQELKWLRHLLRNLDAKQKEATPVFEDNAGCLHLIMNPVFRQRSKHIDVRHHFVRECFNKGIIRPVKTKTQLMLADASPRIYQRQHFERW